MKVTDNKLSSEWALNPISSIRPEPADGALSKKIPVQRRLVPGMLWPTQQSIVFDHKKP